jgi:hypothetical protein
MSHTIKMILGCVLPLLLIFLLPLFGVGEGVTLLVFTVLMFACHLFMMGGHGHHGGREGHNENPHGMKDREAQSDEHVKH